MTFLAGREKQVAGFEHRLLSVAPLAGTVDDDNTFVGCRTAVDEFRAERGITSQLVVTNVETEVFWTV